MEHDRPRPVGRRHRPDRIQVDAGWDHVCLRHPADRVVAADDLGSGLLPVGDLVGLLAADVRAEVVHHRPLPEQPQDRELERLRHEREPEVEVEDVGARQQPTEGVPLRQLAAHLAAVAFERPVRLRVHAVALEDDERGVDTAPPQRLDVRPGHAGRVHGAVDDAERPAVGPQRPRVGPGHPAALRAAGPRPSPGAHPARRRHPSVTPLLRVFR